MHPDITIPEQVKEHEDQQGLQPRIRHGHNPDRSRNKPRHKRANGITKRLLSTPTATHCQTAQKGGLLTALLILGRALAARSKSTRGC